MICCGVRDARFGSVYLFQNAEIARHIVEGNLRDSERLTPPRFDRVATFQSTIQRDAVKHKRQRFVAERLDCAPPSEVFQAHLKNPAFLPFAPLAVPLNEFRWRGFHYDRPPPLRQIPAIRQVQKSCRSLQPCRRDRLEPTTNVAVGEGSGYGFVSAKFAVRAGTSQFINDRTSIGGSWPTLPYQLDFAGGAPNGLFYTPGGFSYETWPQGRNATQYQIADDYAWQKGKHSLKFGVNPGWANKYECPHPRQGCPKN